MLADPTPDERRYLDELATFLKEETGYQWIQGTRPQTLAFGLTDSPAGLAAWIVEKFRIWTDCGGEVESVLSKDQMLANISLYWFTGAIGSSFWPYYARMHGPWPIPEGATVDVPTGYAEFPSRDPAPAALAGGTNLRRHSALERDAAGRPFRGHGAAGRSGGRGARVLPAVPPPRLIGLPPALIAEVSVEPAAPQRYGRVDSASDPSISGRTGGQAAPPPPRPYRQPA